MNDFPATIPTDVVVGQDRPGAPDGNVNNSPLKNLPEKQRAEATLRFAHLLFAGHDYTKAFHLSGLSATGGWTNEEAIGSAAAAYAKRAEVQDELEKLREKTRRVMETQAVYDTQSAMNEAHMAFQMGAARGDAKAMVQSVFLKAKLRGLLVEDRKNERSPLKDLSNEELDGLIKELKSDITVLEGVSQRVPDGPAE